MRRRDFIAGLALVTAMRSAAAQQAAKVNRLVIAGAPREYDLKPLFQELCGLGYVEGKNVLIERYDAEGQNYAQLARDIVRRNPDFIFAIGAFTAKPLKEATSTIPIVVITVDPVAVGLVSSLARPGGNITGVTVDAGMEVWGKSVELLRAAAPTVSKLAILAVIQQDRWQWAAIEKAAKDAHIPPVGPFFVRNATETEYRGAFAAMSQEGADALDGSPENITHRQLIVELTEKHRLPTIYPNRLFVEAGGLLSYGYERGEMWRIVAEEIDQILRGTKPGEIPFYQPTKFELVINLKTAKTLDIAISSTLLAQADEVIE